MSPSDHELARWIDSHKVVDLVNAYFQLLDDRQFETDYLAQIFSEQGRLVRPDDTTTIGPGAIAQSHAHNFARFEATQHLLAGQAAEISGDRAQFRSNLVAIHMWKDRPGATLDDRAFTAGGVVEAELDRTHEGWRIAHLRNRIVWRTGYFGDMVPPSR